MGEILKHIKDKQVLMVAGLTIAGFLMYREYLSMKLMKKNLAKLEKEGF